MSREEIINRILEIFRVQFEIENPGLDDNLRDMHGFDSIDAIELLGEIELFLDTTLTQDEKKKALDIRTLNQVCDYVQWLAKARA